ncbi:MAG TPA: amino acid permease, partial [Kofleriaceae bacterium]|nr:amino acid permease [Kofleriaceae bacterium]
MDREDQGLVRGLGPWAAGSLVVGTIIGTGVFLKTARMTQLGGSAPWVLAAWVIAGALSLAGALTYAELGAMFPEAGGEYVYLREGWGRGMAFLYGWTRFWIGTPGSIAAYAVGAATFLDPLMPWDQRAVAVAAIAVFTAASCLRVRTGGGLQAVLTALKVLLIAGLAIGALATPRGSFAHFTERTGAPSASAFGAMLLAALWAYDGWNNLPMAAGEVRDPAKNLPRALALGSLAVLAIYLAVNAGYFHALPLADIVSSYSDAHPGAPPVAAKAAALFLGDTAQLVLAGAMAISALSAMNGAMLTGARVPYAVARDRMAPRALARLAPGARVPRTAVIVQGVWASVLALSGKFDELTDAVIFASWLFYALNAGS